MSEDKTYGILWDIFNNVNQQLQFAETKNAALITFCLAVVVGIATITPTDDITSGDVRLWLAVMAVTLAGSGLISFTSFLPRMEGPSPSLRPGNWRAGANLIFFQHLAEAHPDDILEALRGNPAPDVATQRLYESLAHQIVVNAGIATRKFAAFRAAAVATSLGTIIPTIILACIWVGNGGYFK